MKSLDRKLCLPHRIHILLFCIFFANKNHLFAQNLQISKAKLIGTSTDIVTNVKAWEIKGMRFYGMSIYEVGLKGKTIHSVFGSPWWLESKDVVTIQHRIAGILTYYISIL
jgi:hypothetical protein